MLVNENQSAPTDSAKTSECFFQVELKIEHNAGRPVFQPIDLEVGDTAEDEMASLELLYRHRRSFALGHGVAADWNRDEELSESGLTDNVRAVAVPTYDLKPIRPRLDAYSGEKIDLSMSALYLGLNFSDVDESILRSLRALSDDYLGWIEHTELQFVDIPDIRLRDAAARHLNACRKCHSRINRGIDCLGSDPDAMLAFRLMNKAMLVQQFHSSQIGRRGLDDDFPTIPREYKNLPGGDRKWRPFQLAFILMNIACMTNEGDPERKIVDLIWFPTGGGKTEAYLGLAAFTICYERLTGMLSGTRVLMRYTLRLLTAQQFQRASALVLALEMIRRQNDLQCELGDEEFSIGLWVGLSLTPNTRGKALSALREMRKKDYARNPFQVLECPWCGVELDNKKGFGYCEQVTDSSRKKMVKFVCPDDKCPFSSASGLPIKVVDEDIYDNPPTLLIGTVDKFAQIAWKDETGYIFGQGNDLDPPSLVIQDELHLISGPLGTMVGLYETAIDRLCSREGHTHKIVASTATIRSAEQQCRDLFNRPTFEFPPQGIKAGDSYFAFEDSNAPGRMYVGYMGSAVKSHQTALVRAVAPLLQNVCHDLEEDEDYKDKVSIVDSYGTLVWYFNSLRELGHAATLCSGDIPEELQKLCYRLDIPPSARRRRLHVQELTSRCQADEIPRILQKLEIPWKLGTNTNYPVDVLLATNMIAVGVDVSRLGLILMSGQPKSASEYIQASSRVGRSQPGLVISAFTQTKSRDRSHYERFISFHQSLYKHVEPTSITPFSPQARDRGMRGVLIAIARLISGVETPDLLPNFREALLSEIDNILNRIDDIDPDERVDAEREIQSWLDEWNEILPSQYGEMGGAPNTTTLAYPFGSSPHPVFQKDAWPIMTSLRNVDGTSEALVLNKYFYDSEQES